MEIDINNVELTTNFNDGSMDEVEEILRNIRIILTTPVGTVPFDRDFGLDWSILDNPLPQAKGLLATEYVSKIRKYEPRAKVSEITFEYRESDGILVPKVVIDFVES